MVELIRKKRANIPVKTEKEEPPAPNVINLMDALRRSIQQTDAAPTQPKFNAPTLQGGNLVLSWTGTGTLQQSDSLTGGWGTAPSQANPQNVPATSGKKFYRISQ